MRTGFPPYDPDHPPGGIGTGGESGGNLDPVAGDGGAKTAPPAPAGSSIQPPTSNGDASGASGAAPGTPEAGKAAPVPMLTPGERARRLYVTTACRTLQEAAEAVGLSAKRVNDLSRFEGWAAERAAWIESDRKRAYAESAESEARAQGNARRLAWTCLSKAIERFARQLDAAGDGGHAVTPFEIQALARTALELSGVGDPAADEDASRLRRLPLPDLAARLREVFAGYGAPAIWAGLEAPAPPGGAVASEAATPPAQ